METMFKKAWDDSQAGKEVDFDAVYREALEESGAHGLNEAWGAADAGGLDQAWSETSVTANLADRPYELAAQNKFASAEDPFGRGMELFRAGNLPDAILAFEAAVSQDGSHAEAWRMLGVAHQENDQDTKAIACLERAVDNDAYNIDALLGLGVSYVNELDQQRALKNLKAWVVNNPKFSGVEVTQDMYGDGSLMDDVMQLMLKAAEWAPNDAEVQQVLGVLYNVSREYGAAALAFKRALGARPDDYSLWNKLGATLANGQRSEEALPAYHRALEIKPKYARGWLNLGISHSNLGQYREAARCYLKALDLNPEAVHIWSYLRICFTCMERFDLIALSDKRNLDAFRAEFKF
jgi:peroxin-5